MQVTLGSISLRSEKAHGKHFNAAKYHSLRKLQQLKEEVDKGHAIIALKTESKDVMLQTAMVFEVLIVVAIESGKSFPGATVKQVTEAFAGLTPQDTAAYKEFVRRKIPFNQGEVLPGQAAMGGEIQATLDKFTEIGYLKCTNPKQQDPNKRTYKVLATLRQKLHDAALFAVGGGSN